MQIVLGRSTHSSILFSSCDLLCLAVSVCPPLGMESHRIDNDQLLTSSVYQHRYGSHRARLNIQV